VDKKDRLETCPYSSYKKNAGHENNSPPPGNRREIVGTGFKPVHFSRPTCPFFKTNLSIFRAVNPVLSFGEKNGKEKNGTGWKKGKK